MFQNLIDVLSLIGNVQDNLGSMTTKQATNVLEYIYKLENIQPYQSWIKSHIAAVGFSSAKPIIGPDGEEDFNKSRRVTFRVISNADIRIKQILELE